MVLIVPLTNVQYRLSRVYSGGEQVQTYNRIVCFTAEYASAFSPYFIEGFNAAKFIVEAARSTWQFRKQTLTPQMLFDFDKFEVIGSEVNDPVIRSRLSLTTAPMGLKINEEQDWSNVFSVTVRDVDASHGEEVEAHNAAELGTNTDVNFYDRDVRSVNRQRNILGERAMISATPAPEPFTEPLMETI